jgi:hypothetical protein
MTVRLSLCSMILAAILFSCENEEYPPNHHTHLSEKVTLQRINFPDDAGVNPNERSNFSISLFSGMTWNNAPLIQVGSGADLGGAGFSFGNTIPASSRIACSVIGDFNGDGVDEYIVGLNSASGPSLYNFAGPMWTGSGVKFYQGSSFWTLAGVAAVDFDGNGVDELITALNSSSGPALYKGNATTIGTAKIYQGPSSLSIVAVAAGDFMGNSHEELISAFNSSSGPSLYRSQGSNVGSIFYQGSTVWTLAAMTAADFDNNGSDELITGLNSANGPALYKGDATTIGYVKIYQGTTSIGKLDALTSGKYGSICKMFVGFNHPTTGMTIHYNDGTNFVSQIASKPTTYAIRALASGNFTLY